MAIAPMSADQSAAAWAGAAAGAAEAYVDAQADAAAAQRDYDEQQQALLAALAAFAAGQNDGVDPPPPPGNPIGTSPVGGNSGVGNSPPTSSTNGGGTALLVPDGNGGYTVLPSADHVVVNQQAPLAWDLHLPIGHAGSGSSSVQTPSNTPPPPDPPSPTNAPNQVNEPDQPEKPKEAPKVVSGFGEEVDKILNLSPRLREELGKLLAAGWRLVETNGKSHCDWEKQRIRINPAEAKNTTQLAVLISHEAGHAFDGPPDRVSAKGRSEQDYVTRNVEARLRAEGGAAFENCRMREEIMGAGGVDITVAGRNSDDPYLKIYADWKNGSLAESEAKWLMGQLMGQEWETRDGTTKRQAFEQDEKQRYANEKAADQ